MFVLVLSGIVSRVMKPVPLCMLGFLVLGDILSLEKEALGFSSNVAMLSRYPRVNVVIMVFLLVIISVTLFVIIWVSLLFKILVSWMIIILSLGKEVLSSAMLSGYPRINIIILVSLLIIILPL